MTDLDIGFIVLGVVPILLVAATLWWFGRSRRDEIYEGITPGEIPVGTREASTRRVGGSGEYSDTVAVRFTPPDDVTPGLAGTVVDGKVDVVDVSATMIDLAVRGYLRIEALAERMPEVDLSDPSDGREPSHREGTVPDHGEESHSGRESSLRPHDFRLVRLDADVDALRPFERRILDEIFRDRDEVTLSALKQDFGLTLREAQIELYRECVDQGWYPVHPRTRSRWLAGIGWVVVGLGVLMAGLVALNVYERHLWGPFEFALPAGLLVSGALLAWRGRGRAPRSAKGTALRIQTLGFKEYLTTAEAGQIRFEEARDIFSRYLPYAIVFGVADRWAKLFGEVAARAHLQGVGDAYFDLHWFSAWDLLDAARLAGHLGGGLVDGDASGFADLLDGPNGLGELASAVGDSELVGAMTDGLGSVADGVGEFVSSASDTVSLGDGCSGGDGCDAPGCIDF